MSQGKELRGLIDSGNIVMDGAAAELPLYDHSDLESCFTEVHHHLRRHLDVLSARLVERAEFDAVYASGGAIARSRAIPDMGLVSLTEMTTKISEIVDAVSLPVIADMDTGYGNALNARHAVHAYERAGQAEFVQKIRAVKDALKESATLVIARTDAIAVEGFSAAIDRASAYAEAGADILFVEAPTSLEQIEKIADALPGPKLMNMFHGGKTPLVSASVLKSMGYQIVIVPSDLQRAAIHGMNRALAAIKRDGDSGSMIEDMVSFKEREEIVGTSEYVEKEALYSS